MKRALSSFLALLFIVSTLLCTVGCSKEYEAANFTVLDSSLCEVELYDYVGKPIVLNFWATWCYYCKIEMPYFDEACAENPGVTFMMVNYTDGYNETVKTASEYVESEGYSFPVFYDTTLDAADAYGIEAFPTTFFISSAGNIIASHEGALTKNELDSYLDRLD